MATSFSIEGLRPLNTLIPEIHGKSQKLPRGANRQGQAMPSQAKPGQAKARASQGKPGRPYSALFPESARKPWKPGKWSHFNIYSLRKTIKHIHPRNPWKIPEIARRSEQARPGQARPSQARPRPGQARASQADPTQKNGFFPESARKPQKPGKWPHFNIFLPKNH
jgi:hypothetical protein